MDERPATAGTVTGPTIGYQGANRHERRYPHVLHDSAAKRRA
jgi:hypothetical protein